MSTTTSQQDRDFVEHVLEIVKESLAGDQSWVLDWVAQNFGPDDVFGDLDLSTWAKENGYILEEE